MSQYRKEKDSMGFIDVPADKYWGAQTQRSAENFKIGGHRMPKEIINAFAVLKMAAAQANFDLGVLPEEKKSDHRKSLSGNHVWKTGRSVPISSMANRLRNTVQYESQ